MKTATYKTTKLAFLIAGAALVASVLWLAFSSPFSGADFNQRGWAAAAGQDERCIRGSMVNDLLKKHVRIGMTKEKLFAVIGQPDDDRGAEVSYYLGFCQTPIDPDTLDFYFDSQGMLTKHDIINH